LSLSQLYVDKITYAQKQHQHYRKNFQIGGGGSLSSRASSMSYTDDTFRQDVFAAIFHVLNGTDRPAESVWMEVFVRLDAVCDGSDNGTETFFSRHLPKSLKFEGLRDLLVHLNQLLFLQPANNSDRELAEYLRKKMDYFRNKKVL
jgi:hypothetical protein